jgi:hypothetical protein
MQTTLRLLESDSPNLWGVLLSYPSGYQQQIACNGSHTGSPLEVGKAVAARALNGLLESGRGRDADCTNWASRLQSLRGVAPGGGARGSEGLTPLLGSTPPQPNS